MNLWAVALVPERQPSKLHLPALIAGAGDRAVLRYGKVTKMTPGIHLKTGFVLDEHGRMRFDT